MGLSRQGYIVLGLICTCYILVTLIALTIPWSGSLPFLLRISGLYGYLSLAIAAMLTPFLTEIKATFGKPFLAVHHFFAGFGLVAITIHPLVNAFLADFSVFIPRFDSWGRFWTLAGRPAFILIYIAVASVLLRHALKRSWRPLHALMYIALLFGFVHGLRIGTDFAHPFISGFYAVLFIGVIGAFFAKRLKLRIKRRSPPPTPLL